MSLPGALRQLLQALRQEASAQEGGAGRGANALLSDLTGAGSALAAASRTAQDAAQRRRRDVAFQLQSVLAHFRRTARFLVMLLARRVASGGAPHLQDALLRLNVSDADAVGQSQGRS